MYIHIHTYGIELVMQQKTISIEIIVHWIKSITMKILHNFAQLFLLQTQYDVYTVYIAKKFMQNCRKSIIKTV